MARIQLTDTMVDIMAKMSEGNPGALTALMECVTDDDKTDPDSLMRGLGPALSLDTMGIYGTDIYVLWSDICEKNTPKFMAVIRAHQLGFIGQVVLKDACSRQDYSGKDIIDVDNLYVRVCERLPNFDMANR